MAGRGFGCENETVVKVRRAYDPPQAADGFRVLVDRLWPRGLRKEDARVDLWLREAAPSDGLRRWFRHDPARWEEFRRRYREELRSSPALEKLRALARRARRETVTLLFAARDEAHNNAVVLAEFLRELSRAGRRPARKTSP